MRQGNPYSHQCGIDSRDRVIVVQMHQHLYQCRLLANLKLCTCTVLTDQSPTLSSACDELGFFCPTVALSGCGVVNTPRKPILNEAYVQLPPPIHWLSLILTNHSLVLHWYPDTYYLASAFIMGYALLMIKGNIFHAWIVCWALGLWVHLGHWAIHKDILEQSV